MLGAALDKKNSRDSDLGVCKDQITLPQKKKTKSKAAEQSSVYIYKPSRKHMSGILSPCLREGERSRLSASFISCINGGYYGVVTAEG